jgi:transposase-like protein
VALEQNLSGSSSGSAHRRDELLPESEGEKADDPHSTAPQEKSMAKRLSRDRTISLPEICKTLNISKATLYRWVNAGGGNLKPN